MKDNISLERKSSAEKLNNKKIEVKKVQFKEFEPATTNDNSLGIEFVSLLEMDVKIELSKAKIKAKKLVELEAGDVIKLNDIAGGQATVKLNKREIAKGEVLVLDGTYGIRISEMKKKNE